MKFSFRCNIPCASETQLTHSMAGMYMKGPMALHSMWTENIFVWLGIMFTCSMERIFLPFAFSLKSRNIGNFEVILQQNQTNLPTTSFRNYGSNDHYCPLESSEEVVKALGTQVSQPLSAKKGFFSRQ